jgi:bifunctional non-homologous end joining protein LigD
LISERRFRVDRERFGIPRTDLLVFDLDPGEGVAWDFVVETAFALREMLTANGLECWPKTTGGKGLHVMVPVAQEMGWMRRMR